MGVVYEAFDTVSVQGRGRGGNAEGVILGRPISTGAVQRVLHTVVVGAGGETARAAG